MKRYNIVGDRPNFEDNEAKLTNIVFVGTITGKELPKEEFLKKEFMNFGNVISTLCRPSLNEQNRSFMLIEMETKEQAINIKRYYSVDDKDGRRKTRLGDHKLEINVLLKPAVLKKIQDFIAPHLNLNPLFLNDDYIFKEDKKNEESGKTENEKEIFWTGFLSKNGGNRIGVDAFLIKGNQHELIDETTFDLNVTNKNDLEEVQKKTAEGLIYFTPSNEIYNIAFKDLVLYFQEKKIVGVIKHLEKHVLNIFPFQEGVVDIDLGAKNNVLIGIFIKKEDEKDEEGDFDAK